MYGLSAMCFAAMVSSVTCDSMQCFAGDTVRIECGRTDESDVLWHYRETGDTLPLTIYTHGAVVNKYRERFSVDCKWKTCTLVIVNVTDRDVGVYMCVESGGLGAEHVTWLVVWQRSASVCPQPTASVSVAESVTMEANTSAEEARAAGVCVSIEVMISMIVVMVVVASLILLVHVWCWLRHSEDDVERGEHRLL